MIVGTLRLQPAPDRRGEILEVFRAIQGPVRAQPGCVACHIYEEQGTEPAVVLVERWESKAALEAPFARRPIAGYSAPSSLRGDRPKSASTTCPRPKGWT